MTDREAMRLALEAFETWMQIDTLEDAHTFEMITAPEAMAALRQALEQPDPFSRLVRIMGTFDLSTGHADNWNDLLDSLESELRDVLGHYREALKVGQEQYDQTALELCDVCGWKTLIPDEGCLNCARGKPWVGLTGDEVNDLKHWLDHRAQWSYIEFARAIEDEIRAKNGF